MTRPARKGSDKVRLSLKLAPGARQRLEELQQISEAESLTDVVRRALALYEMAVKNEIAGGETILRTKDNQEQRIIIDY